MEFVEMKDRIAHIIRAKNLTAAEFAMRLGIQPSNISHLLSGRNNPSLEFVRKLKETFPEYNLDWIVFGKGPMTVSEPFAEPKHLAEAPTEESKPAENEVDIFEGTLFATEKTSSSVAPMSIPLPNEVKRIIVVYADNSFEILSPR
jgi:transcriptional regulator with XRE-family HTH domain